jgi:GT2 family glycosyltransferase
MQSWRYPSNCFCALTSVLRANEENGKLFDENFNGYGEEDTELFYRMYQKGVRMFYCNGALVFHRRHEVPYGKHIEDAKKNIMYFLRKHNFDKSIIEASKEN